VTARITPAMGPVTPPEPPYSPVPGPAAVVAHPDWCDQARCTATPAATMGEAHRGAPVTVTAGGALDDLTVTVSLYQAYAPWLTAVLVKLDVTGRDEHCKPAAMTAAVTIEQAGDLARVLAGLAASGTAWQTRLTEDYLSALQAEVRARGHAGTSPDHSDLTGGASGPTARSHGPAGAA
jgi:hypothetical protein